MDSWLHADEAVSDFIIALHTQLFDASPEIVSTEFAGGVAGLEAVFVGTHTAEFAGVPATGAAVRLPYSVFYDMSDGKILALRAYFPITALLHQPRSCLSPRLVQPVGAGSLSRVRTRHTVGTSWPFRNNDRRG